MRIVLDMQGAQTESRNRGIGRYSISFAQALVRNRGEHEVFLALNGLFPESIEPLRAAFDGLLPQENIRVWFAPGPVSESHHGNEDRRETAEILREAFLASLMPDIIHICSLFEGYVDNAVTSIGKFDSSTPVSVSLFDLIPLLNPDQYLASSPAYSNYYYRKINWLNHASCLLAISESAQAEGRKYLPAPGKNFYNISTAIEPQFRPYDVSESDATQLYRRLGIDRLFILHTGGCDERKNLYRLIEAFAALPRYIREGYQLVFIGKMPEYHQFELIRTANACGLRSDELIVGGYVSDEDLISLYNLCFLYVFPSWHEGFGMPALEAMACGAPVIAANTSSLPEVIGLAEALFDPFDISSISSKMEAALLDGAFRVRLKEHGQLQATKFSWDTTAQRALEAWSTLPKSITNRCLANTLSNRRLIDTVARYLHSDSDTKLVEVAAAIALNQQSGVERQLLVDVSELSQRDSATGVQRVVRSYLKCLLCAPPSGFRVEPVFGVQSGGYYYARRYTSRFWGLGDEGQSDDPICWQRGDIFFGLDMQHSVQLAHEEFFQQLRLDGVTVKFLIYDLLPVQFPDLFYQSNLCDLHAKWLSMLARTDGAICISKATSDSFGSWTAEHASNQHSVFQNDWVHIGADFDELHSSKGIADADTNIVRTIKSRTTFLCVATLEPRKCQQQLLEAMENLWGEGCDYNLVLVGQQGWKTEKLADRIKTHSEFGHRLFWLNGITDEALDRVYAASTCLIAASINEGFGLPIIEAARHGIPIIARDIPVFREVAGSGAFFFTGEDPCNLAEAMQKWIFLSQEGRHPDSRQITWLTWEESTQRLCHVLLGKGYSRRQLLVDVSELAQRDAKTGIQRVVRSILTNWLTNPPIGWRVEPVYSTVDSPYRYARKLAARILDLPCQELHDDVIEFGPGDFFLGLDLAPAVVPAKHEFFQFLRGQGVRVQFLVYDLLPLVSDYFEPAHERAFLLWLSTVAECDGALCISSAVANEMSRWINQTSVKRISAFSIRWFHLGADIEKSLPTSGLSGNFSSVMHALSRCPTFLMVSTLAPHKGHAQVLEAFEFLWNECCLNINLVLVGKVGWRVDGLVNSLRHHPELNKRLFWLDHISDDYLNSIYSASTCLIAASYGEGFGLPLIEAAQHHLPIIVRDIPVFREVAGDHAYYFVAEKGSDLAVHIQDWLRMFDADAHPKSDTLPWQTWGESAARLLDIIIKPEVA
jgi:glycosyltransferase involved in cell wall biosynthesis